MADDGAPRRRPLILFVLAGPSLLLLAALALWLLCRPAPHAGAAAPAAPPPAVAPTPAAP